MERWCLLIATGFLLGLNCQAQTVTPIRIHFLNLMAASMAEIKTTANAGKPIVVKQRTWVTVQPAGDSIGFTVANEVYFLRFEPGKQYYFVIQSTHTTRPAVTEKSEREFILTASIVL